MRKCYVERLEVVSKGMGVKSSIFFIGMGIIGFEILWFGVRLNFIDLNIGKEFCWLLIFIIIISIGNRVVNS